MVCKIITYFLNVFYVWCSSVCQPNLDSKIFLRDCKHYNTKCYDYTRTYYSITIHQNCLMDILAERSNDRLPYQKGWETLVLHRK